METSSTEHAATAEPQKEHRWLEKLVGEWSMDAAAEMAPGEPPVKSTGTERVRSLGGFWFVAEGEGEMPGAGPATSVMTLGYDPTKHQYVGTWIGSMMAQLWQYEGTLDEAGRVLTLDSEGPAMSGEGTANYRDEIEFKSDDHRVMTSKVQQADGSWHEFMTVNYRRTK